MLWDCPGNMVVYRERESGLFTNVMWWICNQEDCIGIWLLSYPDNQLMHAATLWWGCLPFVSYTGEWDLDKVPLVLGKQLPGVGKQFHCSLSISTVLFCMPFWIWFLDMVYVLHTGFLVWVRGSGQFIPLHWVVATDIYSDQVGKQEIPQNTIPSYCCWCACKNLTQESLRVWDRMLSANRVNARAFSTVKTSWMHTRLSTAREGTLKYSPST